MGAGAAGVAVVGPHTPWGHPYKRAHRTVVVGALPRVGSVPGSIRCRWLQSPLYPRTRRVAAGVLLLLYTSS